MIDHFLAWLYWNPNRTVFTVPLIDRPVVWYGLWFVFGFIIGYIALVPMFRRTLQKTHRLSERDILNWNILVKSLKEGKHSLKDKLPKNLRQLLSRLKSGQSIDQKSRSIILEGLNVAAVASHPPLNRDSLATLFPKAISTTQQLAQMLVDRLTWYAVAGTIIGARLGHLLFYQWPRHPLEIFEVWKGGLASHGAAIGILAALFLFKRSLKNFPEFSFMNIVDMFVVPTAFAGCCIRIGNFFNQEILGTPTSVPWAVIFGDPMDKSPIVPRHPVQLYEAAIYLMTFIYLYYLSEKKKEPLKPGMLTGLFFIFVFGARFLLEFFKAPQSLVIHESQMQMGQYLSLPFILIGFFLILKPLPVPLPLPEKKETDGA